jgi:2-polyprenyl-6-methoxyphenol hydroxylase-like FAD-dependent oxidoreductase
MDADVLVVGAGPTGLMLANQLARRGVSTVIIDRHDGPALETRALGVQARTLEIYAHLGFVERAIALGKKATGANMWTRGRRVARVPFGDIGEGLSPYPYLLILGQDDNEKLLGEALRERGLSVEWGTELVGLAEKSDRVVARVRRPDGSTRELTAAWVAGCDGARSSVRELTGVAFLGAPYQHVFFVADTRMTGPMVPDEVNVYLWPEGFHLFFPMRGRDHWRLVGILPPELRSKDDVTLDDVIHSVREEAGEDLDIQACSWFSTYRIHHRRAERFRVRRRFLLGDAAHIHSPVGAQGMNTGLQDAYNLGWKLALVASGRAGEALLDSYESERIPVAQQLLATTDRAFSFVVSDSRLVGLLRTRVIPRILSLAMRVASLQRAAFRTISQIGVHYPESPLSLTEIGLPKSAPRGGDRFPWLRLRLEADGAPEDLYGKLDDTRFTLLLFGQPAPSGEGAWPGDLLRTVVVPGCRENEAELARAGVPRLAFYLLRPDGYVGLCGTRLDSGATARYAAERLSLKTA